jgi:hypothetical protein
MSVGIGRQNIIFLFWTRLHEAALFHFWEYRNGNQTLVLDSHQPFICSVLKVDLNLVSAAQFAALYTTSG